MAKVSKCLEASAAGQLAVTTDVKTSIEHSITSDGVLSQLGVEFRCSEIKGAKDAFLVKACASKESRLFAPMGGSLRSRPTASRSRMTGRRSTGRR